MSVQPALQPIVIERDGDRLFGIAHVPPHHGDVAVVFLSSGLQNRAGPHRMYVKAARAFGALGLLSLRVDLPGVGDSADRPLEANFDCHDPASVLHVTEFVARHYGVRRIVLLGLCAGARVAVKAAARDRRVDAVVAWSVPIVSGPVNMPVAKGGGAYMGKTQAKRQLREWAPKLLDPRAWYRYVTAGKSLSAGWGMMRRALAGLLPERLRPTAERQSDFFASMEACLRTGRKMLFVYGEDDPVARAELTERFPEVAAGRAPSCEYVVVPQGDHTFTRVAATDEVIERTRAWLARHYVP
jgi:pimeloyl-ACP methyl ester carboxylesterase